MTKKYQRIEFHMSARRARAGERGDLGDCRRHERGLPALAVGAGLQVMPSLIAADVAAACGAKGKHDPGRKANRHGTERGSVTLGRRRVPVIGPRVCAIDGSDEVPVPAYEVFNGTPHVSNAVTAVRKLVTCVMEAGPHVTHALATSCR